MLCVLEHSQARDIYNCRRRGCRLSSVACCYVSRQFILVCFVWLSSALSQSLNTLLVRRDVTDPYPATQNPFQNLIQMKKPFSRIHSAYSHIQPSDRCRFAKNSMGDCTWRMQDAKMVIKQINCEKTIYAYVACGIEISGGKNT